MSILFGICWNSYSWIVDRKEAFLKRIFQDLTWLSPDFWCYLRMMLAIAVVYMSYQGHNLWAAFLFIIALVTDLIDGVHARATDQVSDEGAKLDANADKVLIGVILLFIGTGIISRLTISILLSVEGFLFLTANFLKSFLKQRYGYPLTVGSNRFGKIKMVIQSAAVGFLLISSYSQVIIIISEYLLWTSILFGVGSLLGHLYRMDRPVEPRMRIITVPNVITLTSLILLVPTGFAVAHENWSLSIFLLTVIFLSDWLDGKLARALGQETAFGAVIDPIRDYFARFFVITWYFMWFDVATIRIAIITVILVEVFSAVVNLYTAHKCRTVALVNKWGKYRAITHYVILGIIFFHKVGAYELPNYALSGCLFLMLLSSLVALIFYVKQQSSLMLKKG